MMPKKPTSGKSALPPGNPEPQLGPGLPPTISSAHENNTENRRKPGLVVPKKDAPKKTNLGWYRRYLPHRDRPGLIQSITYRLADSLPQEVLDRIAAELKTVPLERMEAERRLRMEEWLDAGHGSCALRNPEAAEYVAETWKRFDGERYDLIAWVIMPNHVHVLIGMYPDVSLGKIVQSWKSFTGKRIGKLMPEPARAGARGSQGGDGIHDEDSPKSGVWMREYWDRVIRDEKHFNATVEYIKNNPVKAGLVRLAEEWPWSLTPLPPPGTPSPSSGRDCESKTTSSQNTDAGPGWGSGFPGETAR